MSIPYQIATVLVLILVGPFLLLRRGSHYLSSLPGRFGRYRGPVPDAPLWIHAVSVGEVGVAGTLIGHLPTELPLLVTTITPTGQERARALFDTRAAVAYLPFDLKPLVRRFLDRFSPRALVLVEGDLWPIVLASARRRGLPIAVVNGRISDRSFRRMVRLKWLLKPILAPVDTFGVQGETDRRRLLELGVEPERVIVTGNLKFDTAHPGDRPQLTSAIRELARGRPVLVAGSTMAGEEELVLEAFRGIGGGERALLVIAPRHPERWGDVAELIERRGYRLVRRSQLEHGPPTPDVLLLDTLGELAAVYGCGIGCFVGGTLVPTGGHNPLEPAVHGVAISVGPSMENFRDIAVAFDRHRAWCQVADVDGLEAIWSDWLQMPDGATALGRRAQEVVRANRGSLGRTLELLAPLLSEGAGSRALPKGAVR